MNSTINRRVFLKQSAALGAGLAAWRAGMPAIAADSANKKIVLAVIGTNARGLAHINGLLAQANAEIAYICDVDDRSIAKGLKAVAAKGGKEPKGIKDLRRVLEDKSVDAVTIATPNHWHSIAAIMACQAGKHVYVEKPGSHDQFESESLVAAAKKHDRVVQMGNQRRSMPTFIEAIAALHKGAIGRLLNARCYYTRFRPTIGHGKEVPPPTELDYTLWQGAAPDRPYKDNMFHYNWHWFWHWGNGELGNNAVHALDLARWGLQVDRPKRVTWGGGRYLCQDDQETPDTGLAAFDFGDKLITWEQSSSHARAAEKLGFQVTFYGEGGTMIVTDPGHRIFDPKGKETVGLKGKGDVDVGKGSGSDSVEHFANFLDCIRTGNKPNSQIEDGQRSTMYCHYANLAVRTGRTINIDQTTGQVIGDPEATALCKREYRPGWEPKV
ncbi:MAG: Gfo/Idh/MocA family oxidoreductase [Verrucomicrobia bacterium]|nr:Gfo/Idh/MocA family oxidoreductase [Verrucomicrobiota bacterium]